MKSSVINVGRQDWDYMRQLKSNIRWMKERPNPEDYLISTRKENELLQNVMKKVIKPIDKSLEI